jgi:hypothetical protein
MTDEIEPVIAQHYQDLDTGCVYGYDAATDTYVLEYCPPEVPLTTSGDTPPANPGVGDVWIDTSQDPAITNVWDGTQWQPSGGIPGPVGPTGPPGPTGDPGPPGAPGSDAAVDTIPPDQPLIKALSSNLVTQEDGTSLTAISVTLGYLPPPPGLNDLAQFVIQLTRETDQSPQRNPDWTKGQTRYAASADLVGGDTTTLLGPVVSATPYYVRAAAIDIIGNRSAWSLVSPITTAVDLDGPARVTGITVVPGMGVLGVRWDPVQNSDFAYVEVGIRVSPAGSWLNLQTAGTVIVLTNLLNGTLYDLRLRSVDWSGNTLHDTGNLDTDGNPVYVTLQVTDPEVGWSVLYHGTPTPVPANALVWDSAIIEDIFAGQINADWIDTGTLKVGGANASIEVYDAGDATHVPPIPPHLIGSWDENGLTILDPDPVTGQSRYEMSITDASLIITDLQDPLNPFDVVTINPLGIDAASVTFGSARGGHNLVLNSSFELGAFVTQTLVTAGWDVAADWNAAGSRQGADINLTTGAGTITMTSVT